MTRSSISATALGLMTAATVVTSLRGLPSMAQEELTMFLYIGFSTLLFLIPAGLVAAELGGAFADRTGGVYTWVGEAFGSRWGFLAIWLQWIQNVVWYPTGLSFAAAAIAFAIGRPDMAGNNVYVGLFCIVVYWIATFIAFSGTTLLTKVTQYGFMLGTVVPGAILIGLFVWWWATGHPLGWESVTNPSVATDEHGHHSPRWLPVAALGTLAFLGTILLNFAGVESTAVHVKEMRNPRRDYPIAIFIAAAISFVIFTLGALAVAAILPYAKINLNSGVFDTLTAAFTALLGVSWPVNLLAVLICYGALGGALAWLGGPSKGLLATAHDGMLPPVLQKTNARGVQRNILVVQGVIVTLISAIYLFMDNVSVAFFLISSMTISLYIIMYLLLYAAAIRLRKTRPDLPRGFRVPALWLVAGAGFAAVAFALVVSFVPPSQLPIGSPGGYVALVAAGTVVFTGLPLLIYQFRKPSWQQGREHASLHPIQTGTKSQAADSPGS
ncbi:amino acid permease [Nonomuraea typhae]|uniref:amino acid permease n=1 Tax=Nonomuraea typhae TaxID=2603600 RepID=UPI0012FBBD8C|nr:amino acid permease [Nonomuraea typhae]